MSFELSNFGKKFSAKSGITELMEDLGNAVSSSEKIIMMGGGNPACIKEIQNLWRKQLDNVLSDKNTFDGIIETYDSAQGNNEFIDTLADFFNKRYNWKITSRNIAITNGSQNAFFMLFNMFAGDFSGGRKKKILIPMVPEYIGYADQGLSADFFVSFKPKIELTGKHSFKYHVDFDNIKIDENIGAICISRPTNPSGNVLTDNEVEKLVSLGEKNKIPVIIDNAYGLPFPNIIFKEVNMIFNENVILSMSLSKLGLPAVRTGIVIANEEIIYELSSMNAIINLATGSFGPGLTLDLFKTGEIEKISNNIINPYYKNKSVNTINYIKETFKNDFEYYIHESEGAFFLWLWFKNLPIESLELYKRLKKRNVLVLPGHYFFPGLEEDFKHTKECIRITYSQDFEDVKKGIEIIYEEVKKCF